MNRKIVVEIIARFDIHGGITPLALIWEDGCRYEIDRVVEARRAASLKAGGQGMRYLCVIRGRERFLYYEDPTWFVEGD